MTHHFYARSKATGSPRLSPWKAPQMSERCLLRNELLHEPRILPQKDAVLLKGKPYHFKLSADGSRDCLIKVSCNFFKVPRRRNQPDKPSHLYFVDTWAPQRWRASNLPLATRHQGSDLHAPIPCCSIHHLGSLICSSSSRL